MSYILLPSAGTKPEVMTWRKTGQTDFTNLPYTIVGDSLVDLGSTNWTQVTADSDHPSMEITTDYGVKFTEPGYYQVNAGLFLYGTAPVSGTKGIISQNLVATQAPDPAQPGWFPAGGVIPDISYNRFDQALANQGVLGLDPDLNCVIKVTSTTTIWFYVRISGTPNNQMVVRADATNALSTMSIVRLGDLQ